MGKYLDILARTETYDKNDRNDKRAEPGPLTAHRDSFGRLGRFLARWGHQAHDLGWTVRDLFGLFPVPEHARTTFNRLARYDETGLIWLLQGREVTALAETTAAIRGPMGAITVYRRHNKPAVGPLGDSLDDLAQ
jgi:hypothetical protein